MNMCMDRMLICGGDEERAPTLEIFLESFTPHEGGFLAFGAARQPARGAACMCKVQQLVGSSQNGVCSDNA